MPFYLYSNPNTGEIKEIYQKIDDLHVYHEDGIQWNREFTVPQAMVDTKIDPLSSKDFVEKTSKKTGTLKNLIYESKKASEERKKILGYDPVQKEYYRNWSKERKGRRHPKDPENV